MRIRLVLNAANVIDITNFNIVEDSSYIKNYVK